MAIVNATHAAQLVGVTEKTMRSWLQATPQKVRGRKVIHTGAGPGQWEIETDDLVGIVRKQPRGRETNDELSVRVVEVERQARELMARVRVLEATRPGSYASLVRSGAASAMADNAGDGDDTSALPPLRPVYWALSSSSVVVGDTLPDKTIAGRWLARHGVRSADTARRWFDNEGLPPYTKRQALQIAIDQNTHNLTVRHRTNPLHRCGDEGCLCSEMLEQ